MPTSVKKVHEHTLLLKVKENYFPGQALYASFVVTVMNVNDLFVYVRVYGSQSSMVDIFISNSPRYFLRQGLLTEFGTHQFD